MRTNIFAFLYLWRPRAPIADALQCISIRKRHVLLLPSSLHAARCTPYKQTGLPKSHGHTRHRMKGGSATLKFEGGGHNEARTKSPTTESGLGGSELVAAPSPVASRWQKAGTDPSVLTGSQLWLGRDRG